MRWAYLKGLHFEPITCCHLKHNTPQTTKDQTYRTCLKLFRNEWRSKLPNVDIPSHRQHYAHTYSFWTQRPKEGSAHRVIKGGEERKLRVKGGDEHPNRISECRRQGKSRKDTKWKKLVSWREERMEKWRWNKVQATFTRCWVTLLSSSGDESWALLGSYISQRPRLWGEDHSPPLVSTHTHPSSFWVRPTLFFFFFKLLTPLLFIAPEQTIVVNKLGGKKKDRSTQKNVSLPPGDSVIHSTTIYI